MQFIVGFLVGKANYGTQETLLGGKSRYMSDMSGSWRGILVIVGFTPRADSPR